MRDFHESLLTELIDLVEGLLARRLAAFFIRESNLDELAVREGERVHKAEILAGPVRMHVDLVAVADLEQPPIADPEPAQTIGPNSFERPDDRRAVFLLDVEMEPRVRVLPIDLLENALDDHVLGDVELRLDRMMRICRRTRA